MTDKIEEVAWAIANAFLESDLPDIVRSGGSTADEVKDQFKVVAVAALKAMSEPTSALLSLLEEQPPSSAESYVVIWDDPLGFVLNVAPEYRVEMAKRMRELADAVERGD